MFGSGIALIGATLAPYLLAGAEPVPPAPAPPAPAPTVFDSPLVAYPPVTPWTSFSAHSISELRHLKTATGSPRLPVPNPWFPTDLYQGTITRAQFEQKLHSLYDPFNAFAPYLDINDQRVVVYPSTTERKQPQFVLQFAPPNQPKAPIRWFRTPAEIRSVSHPLDKPLNGVRIAIDPGHIGGPWAQMEERSTRYHGSAPVQEGDLNLITGRLLKTELQNLGATVYVDRDSTDPVTPYRPDDFIEEARELLMAHSKNKSNLRALPPDKLNLLFGQRLTELSEFLFYRCSEIIERGNRIRNNFVPDITVVLYIDATPGSGQILPELRRDQWAALLHRPVSRSVIFFGKAGAGLLLYFTAATLPLLASAFYAATPGQFAAPLLPEMLRPALSDLFLGAAFYFAAILLCLHRGRWFGSRGAIGLSVIPLFLLHLDTDWPFLLAPAAAAVYLLAGWGRHARRRRRAKWTLEGPHRPGPRDSRGKRNGPPPGPSRPPLPTRQE